MSKTPKRVIDAEFEVIHPGSRPEKPHWSVISWADMSGADRIALVISWICLIGAAIYWGGELLQRFG